MENNLRSFPFPVLARETIIGLCNRNLEQFLSVFLGFLGETTTTTVCGDAAERRENPGKCASPPSVETHDNVFRRRRLLRSLRMSWNLCATQPGHGILDALFAMKMHFFSLKLTFFSGKLLSRLIPCEIYYLLL